MNPELIGWIISALPCVVLTMSAAMKLLNHPTVVKNLTQFGFKPQVLRPLGLFELVLVAVYLLPASSFVGAILLTGWMGGAIATHFRVGDKFIIQTALPVLIWVGWGLRHEAALRLALGYAVP